MRFRSKRWLAAVLSALLLFAPLLGVLAETLPEPTAEAPRTNTSAPAVPEKPASETPAPAAPETPAPTAPPAATAEPTATPEVIPPSEPAATPEAVPSPEITAEPTAEPAATPEEGATPQPSADGPAENTPVPEVSPTPALDEEEDQGGDPPKLEDGALKIVSTRPYAGWRGVTPSGEQGMPIPMLFQTDYPDTVCTIRGIPRSVATSGCGATSLSMVIAYLTGNTEQNPSVLFCDSVQRGLYQGAGWSHETLSYYASAYGVKSSWISNSRSALVKALSEGKPVIAHMGPGIFTSRGHYVVLRGLTSDGKVLINDPVSMSKCGQAFPIQTLLTQARGTHAFMVCWADDMPEYSAQLAASEDAVSGSTETPEMAATPEPIATAAAPTAAPEPADAPVRSCTPREDAVRLRVEADIASPAVCQVNLGDTLQILGEAVAPDGTLWYEVKGAGMAISRYVRSDMVIEN